MIQLGKDHKDVEVRVFLMAGAAKFVLSKGIKIAIAGRFGSKVIDVFRANNVQIIIPQTEQTISKTINSFKQE